MEVTVHVSDENTLFNVVFKNLTRKQIAALLALTKDLGHDRVVTNAKRQEDY